MKTKDYVTIAIRLLALFLLLFSIQNTIPHVVYLIDNDTYLTDSVIAVFIPVFGFAILWYFSPKLAQVVTADIPSQSEIKINHEALLRIIVIALGFGLAVNSVINSSYWFFNNMVFKANPEFSATVDTIHLQKTYLATELVQTLIAVMILVKNSWITQALLKINAPETAQIEPEKSQSD